jgi:UDP-N-acetylmuramate dehydrogenase
MTKRANPGDTASRKWSRADLRDLAKFCSGEGFACSLDEPLSRHISMGIGGPAAAMIWPPHPEAVAAVVAWIYGRGLCWRVLGGGTNVMAGDRGVKEAVICLTSLIEGTGMAENLATFPAGLPTTQALNMTVREGWDGLVWATGLPGTIGGAVAGNAGCWGGEMGATVSSLEVVTAQGSWLNFAAADLSWSYRRLDLAEKAGAGSIIVSATMALEPGDPKALAELSAELQARKRSAQPVGARNAGCVFRNPEGDRSAGLLIDTAGCKGMRVGNAEVSNVHANFIINHGGASGSEIAELIERVKGEVEARFGVLLEEEIRRW